MIENKNYIAYLDLLGIKSIANFDYESYFRCVAQFQNTLLDCQTANIQKLRNKVHTYIFSDCAYLESDDFDSICIFLRNLRYQLIDKGIFFNAAVTSGTLGQQSIDKNNLIGNLFHCKDTVKVNTMQSSFSGVGIRIDDAIARDKMKNNGKELILSCFSIWNEEKKSFMQFVPFFDLKYKSDPLMIFYSVLKNFIRTAYLDKRASRYYFSAMKTCVSQMNAENISELVGELEKISLSDYINSCLIPLFYIIVDRIYYIATNHYACTSIDYDPIYDSINDDSLIQDILGRLLCIFRINDIIGGVSLVSSCVISNRNKYLFSKYLLLENYDSGQIS